MNNRTRTETGAYSYSSTKCTKQEAAHSIECVTNAGHSIAILTVWSDIEAIERVQKRATKQVKQIRKLSYCERLKKLNLPTLRYLSLIHI